MAEDLIITRERYAKYEDGSTEPPLEILLRLSRYFRISMDLLVTVDMRKYKLEEILKLPDNRILLPIKTDSIGENLIEVVPYKASMGYLSGYADPEYIENLQTMSLPFLHNGKYRAFPAEGDSMPPYKDGTYVIGQYVERITDIKVGKTYILITKSGFLFKRIERINETTITVKSDNTFYDHYDIPFEDLWEAWQHAGSYSPQELEVFDFANDDVKSMLIRLMQEVKELKDKIT
ncbi:S24 family peptidase [Chryseobacterium kwangjuense]|nr:S24 family peptidase [Chryseobacterium kwangjuense]